MQKIFRLYPPGYTYPTIDKLEKLLTEGWTVKLVTTSKIDKDGGVISDYILENTNIKLLDND